MYSHRVAEFRYFGDNISYLHLKSSWKLLDPSFDLTIYLCVSGTESSTVPAGRMQMIHDNKIEDEEEKTGLERLHSFIS